MTTHADKLANLERFGAHYSYDTTYLQELLNAAPEAFDLFSQAQPMGRYREQLPLDAHIVARLSAMQSEDCGPCAQLTLRMAVEEGVSHEFLRTLLEAPGRLPQDLQDVREHARYVVGRAEADPERLERLRRAYGNAGVAELALAITGARMYPALKRALGHGQSCERLSLDF